MVNHKDFKIAPSLSLARLTLAIFVACVVHAAAPTSDPGRAENGQFGPGTRDAKSASSSAGGSERGIRLFAEHIRPVFEKNCLACHNRQEKKAGFDLSTREALLRGGSKGPAVVPGNARESLLYKLVAYEDQPWMPSGMDKLAPEIIAQIAEWINVGAPYDRPLGTVGVSGATPAPQSEKDTGLEVFVKYVRPILEGTCLKCHGGGVTKSGFDLSTRQGLLRGGDHGPAVVAGDTQGSPLYQRIRHRLQPGMPFSGERLSEEVIARFAEWINAGAPYDSPLTPAMAGVSDVQSSPPVAASLKPASQRGNAAGLLLFAQSIRPVLEANCLRCHGGGVIRSGLDLSTRAGLLQGGDKGLAVVSRNAEASALYKRVRHELQPGMPFQGEKLPEEVIARIGDWINAGAPYDGPLKMSETTIHWAFKPPKSPLIPAVKNGAWVRNPIDAFVFAELEKRGLKPVPQADKRTLLRRVYLDLVGFPPKPEEMAAFLTDRSKDAYEEVVDRLLSSPHYGERWGRHWMDVWRYSDWYGFGHEVRNSQPHLWHWRDWIIDSLNQDKDYDRMIVEMLAGDEVAPGDPQVLRATGYLARDWYRFNRNVWLQETVEHTAAAFLGITMKCARCHDHKYDPIRQEEYYRFRAFFEPYDVRLDRVPGQPDLGEDGTPRVFDAEPREAAGNPIYLPAIYKETYRFIRGDESNPDTLKPLSPAPPTVLNHGANDLALQPVHRPLADYYPDLRPFVQPDLIAQAGREIEKAERSLARATTALAEARKRVNELAGDGGVVRAALIHSDPAPMAISFEKEIKPILEKNCFACHDSTKAKSGLVLESVETMLQGGDVNGPAIIPRASSRSPLVLYLRGEKKPRMPADGKALSQDQINLIARWIDQLPEDDPPTALAKAEAAAALAEKRLAAARANLPALEARIAADQAKYAESADPPVLQRLAEAAAKAERRAKILKAEENLLRAQQRLGQIEATMGQGEEKENQKRLEEARNQVKAAEEALAEPPGGYTPVGTIYPSVSSGRRLALAQWIANKDNPLTARVAINHMWLRHFGKALVPTVINFGQNGAPPTSPELLDWLAVQFMNRNWSMKAMHRLMVTSSTYRMQSFAPPQSPNRKTDPENRYFWRMNSRRMEAEVVRDSVLYLSGQLDMTLGGAEIGASKGEEVRRRSLYFQHTPDSQAVFLKLFDQPDPTDCYERPESVIPQQALAMANGPLSLTSARLLAKRISGQIGGAGGDRKFIASAYETVLNRPPSAEERRVSEEFIREQTTLLSNPKKLTPFRGAPTAETPPSADPHLRARENLVAALLNHTDFVTIR